MDADTMEGERHALIGTINFVMCGRQDKQLFTQ